MIASILSEGETPAQGTAGGAPRSSPGISWVPLATRGCMK